MDPTRPGTPPEKKTAVGGSSITRVDDSPVDSSDISDPTKKTVGDMELSDEPVDQRSLLPKRIGPYEIQRLLGAGGMGSVYLGKRDEDGSLAAVKVLPASLAREDGFIERFNREIAALERLENPHVVSLLGHGVDRLDDGAEVHYYAMEFVAGETLTERLRREKRLPWERVIELSVQVCSALKAAHNAGIIHRDLKPSNLMIDVDGNVKLTDFGVAQLFASTRLTMTGGILGTAEYMSPEQAEGKRVTKQADIYSLGALMYVALTGRPPFTGKTPLEIAQMHRTHQFDAPRRWVSEIPHWLDEIVCQCLSKLPEERYPDAHILSRRLEEVPKKYAMARSEMTGGMTAATVATGGRLGQPAGGATLAAEMMRADIEIERRGSLTRRLLDNPFVLLFLLALVGLVAFAMTRERPVDAEEMFARGNELMEQRTMESMRTARDKYFRPLLEIDQERWEPEVAPLLSKIETAEVVRGPRSLTGSHDLSTEPQRLLHYGLEQRRMGDIAGADATLAALRELVRHDSSQQDLVAEIDNIRGDLVVQLAKLKREVFIESKRVQAAELRAAGDDEAADAMLAALKTVYDDAAD